MTPNDAEKFRSLIVGVYALYGREVSDALLTVWWQAMRQYDFAAVQEAMNRHALNPDAGQFPPKPADVVKLVGGSTQDGALLAWAAVDRAMRSVGCHVSVVFDDALIHAVIADMGGWTLLGAKTDEEWPFVAREFENRYRGYRLRGGVPAYPPVLIGHFEAHNASRGLPVKPPVLLGDAKKARAVLAGGVSRPLLAVTPLDVLPPVAQKAIEKLSVINP